MNDKGNTGVLGENAAAEFLESGGFKIIARNFRTRFGEIDIIAENREFIVFAEVKTRKNNTFANAREYVDYRKQSRLIKTAEIWLSLHSTSLQPRFDVIEVYYTEDFRSVEIKQIADAFGVN